MGSQGKAISTWLKTEGAAKMAKLQKLIDAADFSYTEKPDLYNISRDREAWVDWKDHSKGKETLHEEAIIQLVEAPGITKFINKVNRELGFHFPIPFPHISIAVKGTKFGIGIADKEAFKKLNPVKLDPQTNAAPVDGKTTTLVKGPSKVAIGNNNNSDKEVNSRDQALHDATDIANNECEG